MLGSTKSKISKDKNGETAPHIEITEVVSVHDSRVLYTFIPNKSFGSLLEISPTNHIFLKTFHLEYNEIEK